MDQPAGDAYDRLFEAAAALRETVNLFTDRELDDEIVAEVAEVARKLSARLDEAPPWDRQAVLVAGMKAPASEEGRRTGFPYRAIAGAANPAALPMELSFSEDAVETEITLSHMHGGAPGRGHGGVLAGIFDDFAGAALNLLDTMGATARLTVHYRSPIPIDEPLRLRAWVHKQDGRKVVVRGDARRDGTVVADVEALFIIIDYAAIDTSGAARH